MQKVLCGVLVALSVVLSGCYSCKEAEQAIRDAIAVNEGHMNDKDLPQEAREIAQDNYDFDWKILYGIGAIKQGEIPAEVQARINKKTGGGK